MTTPILLHHRIAGETIAADPGGDLLNPSDLKDVVARAAMGGAIEIDQAVSAARMAFGHSEGATPQKRAALLRAIAERVTAHSARLAAELSREEGKLLSDARAEAAKAAEVFYFYAGLALQMAGEFGSRLGANADVVVTRDPLGVVGLITPWNAPLAIVAWKLAPALMMGNAVVLKPSERAPVCIQSMMLLVDEAIAAVGAPAGLVNTVHGAAEAGAALAVHTGIDALSFTGGTGAGKRIAVAAAQRLLPLQLELGGKNPFVVAADADLDAAVPLIIFGAFAGAGQKCTATSRIVVEEAIARELVDRLTVAVAGLTVGQADQAGVYMGPVIAADTMLRVDQAAEDAEASGAKILARGRVVATSRGHFQAPALVLDDDPRSSLNQTEMFGPIVSLIRVADLDAAIAAANATPFGLSSGIATRSLATARRFRRESRAGIVAINQTTSGSDLHAPFEGVGQSGFGGAEQGVHAPHFFSRNKTAYIAA